MVGSELNCTPGKRGETSGGGAFSRALLSDRREQARREELKMLDPATILKELATSYSRSGVSEIERPHCVCRKLKKQRRRRSCPFS